ncbi:RnfABCDGE type electron transport complex subunit B [Sporomusa sphaeroides]|jgi:electron transport complex protein RnfB|uniref:Ion-translocating oxidoreductase complex subunit B n=1 Tax=Sporomusa sphaeroides DSM 2875 TaxID=1337886 RepID=A0ABP2C8F1_9FIRM|nr:Fe-S cluster domain-containing protein [Sporomusa sphaeroides]OLS57902.1 electron transport complex subunit RsxB [Sporomusa sphaeroides DSM 2875]CVK20415.1 Electron transport complex protein rnfB [Sporomusa sphaeroides DSM 2875]HML31240.1 Fe-S cluster domain-containing protein [Sporomusa sphaeroides]
MKKITAGILFLMLAGFDQAVHAAVAVESSIDANVGADTVIAAIVLLVSMGLLFGIIMAYANKKFAVEVNPLIHIVEDILPKGQCGACGYPGCMGYAEAVVTNPDVPPNLCTPGKDVVAKLVGELTGKAAAPVDPRIAQVRCAGTYVKAGKANEYVGVEDCVAANLLFGGPKSCKYGCLGLGTCVKACPFGAMEMSADGLPIIDPDKCTGCAKCETVCPKKVIAMMPLGASVRVNCNSHDKGAVAKKACSAACIGCTLCMKECPYGAIKMESNLAVVDAKVCIEKCNNPTCLAKCPTKAIREAVLGVVPGSEVEDVVA